MAWDAVEELGLVNDAYQVTNDGGTSWQDIAPGETADFGERPAPASPPLGDAATTTYSNPRPLGVCPGTEGAGLSEFKGWSLRMDDIPL